MIRRGTYLRLLLEPQLFRVQPGVSVLWGLARVS